jgi:TrmH family RNA methyltransferase
MMKNWKNNVYFTIVEPREPGNVGAAARAMKNMEFQNLCLVNPPSLTDDEAARFAHNSIDILTSAEVHNSVHNAIADKHYVVGTSRRRGRRRGVYLPVDEGARRIREIAETHKVALLFGREDRGLFNHEIEECGFLMTVPANKEHPSLNLGQAVMIFAYELMMTDLRSTVQKARTLTETLLEATPPTMAKQEDLVLLYKRLENALRLIGYVPEDDRNLRWRIMQNLKHCLGRAGLTDWEFNMFHSICKHIEQKLGHPEK